MEFKSIHHSPLFIHYPSQVSSSLTSSFASPLPSLSSSDYTPRRRRPHHHHIPFPAHPHSHPYSHGRDRHHYHHHHHQHYRPHSFLIFYMSATPSSPTSVFRTNASSPLPDDHDRSSTKHPMSGFSSVRGFLVARLRGVLNARFPEAASIIDSMDDSTLLQTATKPEFGDYQVNLCLVLAKELKAKPRDIAQGLVDALMDLEVQHERQVPNPSSFKQVVDRPEIAGPGFVNLFLKQDFIRHQIMHALADPTRLGIQPVTTPQRIVVDFSSPNIAKEMHVGHLRSTIIGDSLARILAFLGHDILRLNHVGDWGTQFGMLILYMKEVIPGVMDKDQQALQNLDLGDLVQFYKSAKVRFDEDEAFQDEARKEVVKLQSGEEQSLRAWRILCEQSRKEFNKIYDLLNIHIEERGESYYNPFLAEVVDHLKDLELAVQDQGATCVFLDGYLNRDGSPQPLIIQKSDGGFMYATTDLAAIRHRTQVEKAQRILYLTDVGQATHFDQVFQVARKSNLAPPSTKLEHVPFGLVQGEDGKKFKTRSGDTVKLIDLLDEAIARAKVDVQARFAQDQRNESNEYVDNVAKIIGISAVKYADLKNNRTTNYRFSYDKMLSMQGNTAPYMLYAYARIQGIFRKAEIDSVQDLPVLHIILEQPEEKDLARYILRLSEVLVNIENDLKPNYLCEYLYELSSKFNQFYEKCSVLGADSESLKYSRLALCQITAETIKLSLELLGIETLQRI